MFQVCDEPCYHGQGDTFARPKHQFALQRIKRERIDNNNTALAFDANFARELGAVAKCFSKNYFGEPGFEAEFLWSQGDNLPVQFFSGLQGRLIDALHVFGIILFLVLFEWHTATFTCLNELPLRFMRFRDLRSGLARKVPRSVAVNRLPFRSGWQWQLRWRRPTPEILSKGCPASTPRPDRQPSSRRRRWDFSPLSLGCRPAKCLREFAGARPPCPSKRPHSARPSCGFRQRLRQFQRACSSAGPSGRRLPRYWGLPDTGFRHMQAAEIRQWDQELLGTAAYCAR